MGEDDTGLVVVPIFDALHLFHVKGVVRVCVYSSRRGGVVMTRRSAIANRLMLLKAQAAADYRQLLYARWVADVAESVIEQQARITQQGCEVTRNV